MSNVVRFTKPSAKDRARGKTLCGRGFHKWAVDPSTRFDVKRGKLVTVRRCVRCGTTKTTLT